MYLDGNKIAKKIADIYYACKTFPDDGDVIDNFLIM